MQCHAMGSDQAKYFKIFYNPEKLGTKLSLDSPF
jgi:hypothetical protein